MYWRTVLVLVVLVTLAGTHWKAYVSGQVSVRAEYATKTLAQSEKFRAKEHKLAQAKNKSEAQYDALKKSRVRSAAGAQSELDGLRSLLAQRTERATSVPAPSCTGADGASTERELLGQGAEALVLLAAEADRTAARLSGLQAYVSSVCQPVQ